MAVALHGNLEDFEIGDVFQLVGQQRKTGVLEITNPAETIRLFFDEGRVACGWPARDDEFGALGEFLGRCGVLSREAVEELESTAHREGRALPELIVEQGVLGSEELGGLIDLLTQETVFALLRRKKGSFHFTARDVPIADLPITRLAAEGILMDGLRMVDEWRAFAGQVPTEEMVFCRKAEFANHRGNAPSGAADRMEAAERVYHLVDGRQSVRRVIDLARLGTFAGARLLADLRLSGTIEPVDGMEALAAPVVPPVPRDLRQAGRVAAALAPLVLLAFVLVASPRPTPEPPGLQIPQDPWSEAQTAFATLRLRNALDAYRVAFGGWPARLDDLVTEGFAPPSALAGPGGRPYYYEHREDGPLLLAPEQRLPEDGLPGQQTAATQ